MKRWCKTRLVSLVGSHVTLALVKEIIQNKYLYVRDLVPLNRSDSAKTYTYVTLSLVKLIGQNKDMIFVT